MSDAYPKELKDLLEAKKAHKKAKAAYEAHQALCERNEKDLASLNMALGTAAEELRKAYLVFMEREDLA